MKQQPGVRVRTVHSLASAAAQVGLAPGADHWHFRRVVVADPEEASRRALVEFLRGLRTDVTGARTYDCALRQLGRAPDLLIVDQRIRTRDTSASTLAQETRTRTPRAVVVVLSDGSCESDDLDLRRGGVRLILRKPLAPAELVTHIEATLTTSELNSQPEVVRIRPQTELSLTLCLALFAERYDIPDSEMALVRLAVVGVTRRSHCAAELNISENTCKTLIRRLLRRCGAERLAEVPRLVLIHSSHNDNQRVRVG